MAEPERLSCRPVHVIDMEDPKSMPAQWTPDLAVGVDVIDSQHKEIFARAAQLIEATHRGGGKEEMSALRGYLEQYVAVHLADEEKYMLQFNYDGYEAHRA